LAPDILADQSWTLKTRFMAWFPKNPESKRGFVGLAPRARHTWPKERNHAPLWRPPQRATNPNRKTFFSICSQRFAKSV